MTLHKGLLSFTLLTLSSGLSSAAVLTADYRLNGSLADFLPGGTALTAGGGTLGTNTYTFSYNQGLSVSNVLANGGDYSLGLRFSFTENSGYNKFVDFKNLGSDTGQYVNVGFNFYNVTGNVGSFSVNTMHNVFLTRSSATNTYTAYLDGAQVYTFVDGSALGVFSSPGAVMQFFRDDVGTGGEASPGEVDRIMVWDGALTSAEIANIDLTVEAGKSAVPEPGTFSLGGLAIGAAMLVRRFRK
jgi:hypothetical protein